MALLRDDPNKSVANGRWGEDVAAAALRLKGYVIVDRNIRPCVYDRRLEIDIVAYDREADAMVFVEVKQHARRDESHTRLQSIDSRKKTLLRRACLSWLARRRWRGSYRFDVIEIYGTPDGGKPEIDHVERVRLFNGNSRFVDWS